MNQNNVTERNKIAWEAGSYEAWVNHYGTAKKVAADIVSDPKHTLRRVLGFIGDPTGLVIANPLGSHGRIATALALLGARVTVFDVSDSNARYALELATEAGVDIEYVVGDFQATAHAYDDDFDLAIMELGVVHYFVALDKFAAAVRALLKAGGSMVLNEFHPLLKKSFDIDAGKPVFRGNYFATGTEEAPTPYAEFSIETVPDCLIRRWELGEIVTAFATSRFRIERLVEHPSGEFDQLPGTFTLVARAT